MRLESVQIRNILNWVKNHYFIKGNISKCYRIRVEALNVPVARKHFFVEKTVETVVNCFWNCSSQRASPQHCASIARFHLSAWIPSSPWKSCFYYQYFISACVIVTPVRLGSTAVNLTLKYTPVVVVVMNL